MCTDVGYRCMGKCTDVLGAYRYMEDVLGGIQMYGGCTRGHTDVWGTYRGCTDVQGA